MAVRRRPEKLGAGHRSHEDLDAVVAAAMPTAELREQWRAWHNSRVHDGQHGHFGGDWDVFNGAGYPCGFDDTPSADYRDLPQILPTGNEYTLTICPAASNFSGFPPDTVREFRREEATTIVTQVVLEDDVCVDDVLLVTEARGWFDEDGNENQDVKEYVVKGWEELLEDDGAGGDESDADSSTGDGEEY